MSVDSAALISLQEKGEMLSYFFSHERFSLKTHWNQCRRIDVHVNPTQTLPGKTLIDLTISTYLVDFDKILKGHSSAIFVRVCVWNICLSLCPQSWFQFNLNISSFSILRWISCYKEEVVGSSSQEFYIHHTHQTRHLHCSLECSPHSLPSELEKETLYTFLMRMNNAFVTLQHLYCACN